MPRILICLACSLFATGTVAAASPIAWKLSEGETLAISIHQTSEAELSSASGVTQSGSDQRIDMAWRVESVGDQGVAQVVQDVKRIRLKLTAPGGRVYEFDTDAKKPAEGLATYVAPALTAMVTYDAGMRVAPSGRVIETSPHEAVLQTLKNVPGAAAIGASGEVYRQMLRPALFEAPKGPVEPGQSWVNRVELPLPNLGVESAAFEFTYTGDREQDGRSLAAIEVQLSVERPEEPTAASVGLTSSRGEVLFDRDLGRVVSAELESSFTVAYGEGESATTGLVTQRVEIQVAPDLAAP